MKFITSPVILASVILTCISLAGCLDSIQNEVYKDAIQKAIHEDALTGHTPTSDHVAAMRNVNLSDCPTDFREAYGAHIHAWEERAAVNAAELKLQDEAGSAAIGGMLAEMFGSDATPWGDYQQAVARVKQLHETAEGDVIATWTKVKDVAFKSQLSGY